MPHLLSLPKTSSELKMKKEKHKKTKNKGVPKPLVKLLGVNKSAASSETTSQDAVTQLQERADVNRRSSRMEKSFQGLRSTGQVVITLVATISPLVVETSGDTERS